MSQSDSVARLDRDTPDLAKAYEQIGVIQFNHGKLLIAPLALKTGEHVLDIGAGTGRLAEFVASLVAPTGRVVGIDPLQLRISIAEQRQSATLSFAIGYAEDLSCFGEGQFDVVYLNSVFHWIVDKAGTLRQIHRVLKPGGRLGLNTQDPSRPHRSREFIRAAISTAGLEDRHDKGSSVVGSTDDELRALFETSGFVDYASGLRSFVDVFSDAAALVRWSEASAFGNFLDALSDAERQRVQSVLAGLVESERTPRGVELKRYLRFSFGRKPPSGRPFAIPHEVQA